MRSDVQMLDGNEAVAHVAYLLSEVVAIYPITPSSTMGELADQWASEDRPNLWGVPPTVVEMQSEGGAAGAVHGALQAGALATTFTASQGLLLMIPNLYKIAGELTPLAIHVAARALATHALSIFGDHSDVMACRATGCAMLASGSVQEAADLAAASHAATLESRIPFLHFFDGFRTSHEVNGVSLPTAEQLRELVDPHAIAAHRSRALSPDRPLLRGTSQNPDVFFQAREAANPFYLACPAIVQDVLDRYASLTGRQYHLCDYSGAPDAERVIVVMGSAAETVRETVAVLQAQGEKVGLVQVRLYRPFPAAELAAALPATVRKIAVLDRTKEPGAVGEPLYLDVVAALAEQAAAPPRTIVGGRYGLASKEFTPAMVRAVFAELAAASPRRHFTVGIRDDVTHLSLAYDAQWSIEADDVERCVFYGLGADGTVSANKNSIKIIGQETDRFAQGYFVYDSKKSGSVTVSHLRFGPRPIRAPYLIERATFVACHQFQFLEQIDVLQCAGDGAVVLLNAPYSAEEVWDRLPRRVQTHILNKRLRVHVIDADRVARAAGLGGRINTVMQTCFFALTRVLPREAAVAAVKHMLQKTYGKRGPAVVERNFAAVDQALENLQQLRVPAAVTATFDLRPPVPAAAPQFVQQVSAELIAGRGDQLPVSALPPDGTWPTGTARWEKRNIAREIPVWDSQICIQCGKCVLVCPHAVIRAKLCDPLALGDAPEGFPVAAARWPGRESEQYTLQVAPEDCTGCALCVEACPVKNKSQARLKAINMQPVEPLRDAQRQAWDFFLELPDPTRSALRHDNVKDLQLLTPLFEFSGACAGCGETPYLKLLTQLCGDRLLVANATGCSSIYGGNLPTTPWTVNALGRGPAWSNSLFEDNAEFGLGMELALDQQARFAAELLRRQAAQVGQGLVQALLEADQTTEAGVEAQRERVRLLQERLRAAPAAEAALLAELAGALVRKSVWIVGGDGWAYDIGFGGLDHVLAIGRPVKVLVLDTEVYSNTGGQMSKATPLGAVAKFAASGKRKAKKDLALMAMTYGHAYVARIAFGAADAHAARIIQEAEQFPGPALILAFSTCIAHGYDLIHSLDQQKAAVQSGYWPLFHYDPRRLTAGQNPLQLDSKPPSLPLAKYMANEMRFELLRQSEPPLADQLLAEAQRDVHARWRQYEHLAALRDPAAALATAEAAAS